MKEEEEGGRAKKKYNPYLIYLFRLVDKVTVNFVEDQPKILSNIRVGYEDYINDIDGKVVILSKEAKILVIPYIHRSHELYLKKVKKRLKPLRNIQLHGVFLTITSNPNVCNSYKDMHIRLSKAWNRLNSYIKYKYGNVPYLKVLEITKSGLLHLHVVFIGLKYLLPQDKLSKMLNKYGVGYVCHISYVQRGRNAMSYVMKYLTKVHLNNKDKTNSKTNSKLDINHDLAALTTALRARLFSISKTLQGNTLIRKEESEGGWEYIGTYPDKHIGYGILDMDYIQYIYS